jgi:hypothetical protein
MNIINLLSSVRGFSGNNNEIDLAKQIADNNDTAAIKDLAENLSNKDKRIQSDCLKCLYETGYLKPELIAPYFASFLKLLTSKNNRMVWGSMIALATISNIKHKEIFEKIDLIIETVNAGSVITIDAGVQIYAALLLHAEYFDKVDPLLMEQLAKSPIKQLPQYAEKSAGSINQKNKEEFVTILKNRLSESERDSQTKRIEKVLKKMEKK